MNSNPTQQNSLVSGSPRGTGDNLANASNLEVGIRSSHENVSNVEDADDNPPSYEMICSDQNMKEMASAELEDLPPPTYETALHI